MTAASDPVAVRARTLVDPLLLVMRGAPQEVAKSELRPDHA